MTRRTLAHVAHGPQQAGGPACSCCSQPLAFSLNPVQLDLRQGPWSQTLSVRCLRPRSPSLSLSVLFSVRLKPVTKPLNLAVPSSTPLYLKYVAQSKLKNFAPSKTRLKYFPPSGNVARPPPPPPPVRSLRGLQAVQSPTDLKRRLRRPRGKSSPALAGSSVYARVYTQLPVVAAALPYNPTMNTHAGSTLLLPAAPATPPFPTITL